MAAKTTTWFNPLHDEQMTLTEDGGLAILFLGDELFAIGGTEFVRSALAEEQARVEARYAIHYAKHHDAIVDFRNWLKKQ